MSNKSEIKRLIKIAIKDEDEAIRFYTKLRSSIINWAKVQKNPTIKKNLISFSGDINSILNDEISHYNYLKRIKLI